MIRKAEQKDLESLTALALALWPEHDGETLRAELSALLQREDAALFLARWDGADVAFAQCQLRRDYVEGTESSPVGYLEGIYVAREYRCRGIARELLAACEDWAAERGCKEFASDCELSNTESLQFHLNVGFQEANRIICFTKRLSS